MNVDVPEPYARLALVGVADPPDALLAFQNGIVANPDGSEFQHMERPAVADVGYRRAQEARPFLNRALAAPAPLGLFFLRPQMISQDRPQASRACTG